jgi:hypothetical protein
MQEKAIVRAGGLELNGIPNCPTVCISCVAVVFVVVVVIMVMVLQESDEGLLGGEYQVLAVQVVLDERSQLLNLLIQKHTKIGR